MWERDIGNLGGVGGRGSCGGGLVFLGFCYKGGSWCGNLFMFRGCVLVVWEDYRNIN